MGISLRQITLYVAGSRRIFGGLVDAPPPPLRYPSPPPRPYPLAPASPANFISLGVAAAQNEVGTSVVPTGEDSSKMAVGRDFCLHQPFGEGANKAIAGEDSVDDDSHPLSDLSLFLGFLLVKDVHSFSSSTSSSSSTRVIICSRVKELEKAEERIKRLRLEMEERRRKEEENEKRMVERISAQLQRE